MKIIKNTRGWVSVQRKHAKTAITLEFLVPDCCKKGVILPTLAFWCWYHLRVKKYIPDPEDLINFVINTSCKLCVRHNAWKAATASKQCHSCMQGIGFVRNIDEMPNQNYWYPPVVSHGNWIPSFKQCVDGQWSISRGFLMPSLISRGYWKYNGGKLNVINRDFTLIMGVSDTW